MLAREAKRLYPKLRVLLTTGYSENSWNALMQEARNLT